MSGWIKLEKDLFTDPRVRRIAKKIWPKEGNAGALPVTQRQVTHVVGGLVKLWVIGDTHCDVSSVMDGDIEDLNSMIGIEGFCQALPAEWFEDLGNGFVKLPNYQEHNGAEAKKKLQSAKRQSEFKKRQKTASNRILKNASNAGALPDQDQDQDQDHNKKKTTNVSKEKNAKAAKEWPVLPDYLDLEQWSDWIQHRKDLQRQNRKGVWNPGAARATLRQLEKLRKEGMDPNECLSIAIAQGWQGCQLHYFQGNNLSTWRNGNGRSRELSPIELQDQRLARKFGRQEAAETDGGGRSDQNSGRRGETFEGDLQIGKADRRRNH